MSSIFSQDSTDVFDNGPKYILRHIWRPGSVIILALFGLPGFVIGDILLPLEDGDVSESGK